ncbi:MAG: hypothetical protein CL565_06220 [Alphaproteobacteria bacterium]|nr:hypothetical protein [Alphaproteobacteria bacterium]
METVKALSHFLDLNDISYDKSTLYAAPFSLSLAEYFPQEKTSIYVYDFSANQKWEDSSYNTFQETQKIEAVNLAVVFPEKNHEQASYVINEALSSLTNNGVLIAVAHNLAGGKRISKIIRDLGGVIEEELSKNHCRVVMARNGCEVIPQRNQVYKNDFGYWSQAGLFGHDKIDRGSSLLLQNIEEEMTGNIADFGCGYGYISCGVAAKTQHNINKIYAYDNDYRAVKCCEKNLLEKNQNVDFEVKWYDLTQAPETDFFDTILLNPPFHAGKKTDISLGKSIIESAAKSLKKRGVIYVVANIHLPYEAVLKHAGISFDIITTKQGFKVFKGVKQ